MKYYFRALSTEFFKLRRTLAFWCVLIAPTLLTVLAYSVILKNGPAAYGPEANAWKSVISNGFNMWGLLVLPLYIALQTTLLAQLEHTNQQWKHLYALPVPRFAYYAAKWTVVVIVMAATHLLLALELAGFGGLIGLLTHQYGLNTPIPWNELALGWGTLSAAALLVLTIHLLVSLWWRSFIPSLGLGVMAALTNIFLLSSETYYMYSPWLYPVMALHGEPSVAPTMFWLGFGGGLLLTLIGGWLFVRKQIN
jgi:lantibiotic transport system permease protein